MLGLMRFALVILTVLVLASAPAWAQDITGPARVIDGDSLEVDGNRIRIHGIDARELGQTCLDHHGEFPCGRDMAKAMLSLVGERPATFAFSVYETRPAALPDK